MTIWLASSISSMGRFVSFDAEKCMLATLLMPMEHENVSPLKKTKANEQLDTKFLAV